MATANQKEQPGKPDKHTANPKKLADADRRDRDRTSSDLPGTATRTRVKLLPARVVVRLLEKTDCEGAASPVRLSEQQQHQFTSWFQLVNW